MSKPLDKEKVSEDIKDFEDAIFADSANNLGSAIADYSAEAPAESEDIKENVQTDEKKSTSLENREFTFISKDNIQDSDGWFSRPMINNQYQVHPKSCKVDQLIVNCLDLSDKEELKEYNKLLNEKIRPDSNMADFKQALQFSDKIGTWKVLVCYSILKFKHPLDKII